MSKLNNGATEIARISLNGRTHVMADRGTDGHECFHRFVTWAMDDEGNCYCGHYFETHNEAVADLLARS